MSTYVPSQGDWDQLSALAERLINQLRFRVFIPSEVGTIEDAVQELMLWLHNHPNRIQHLMALNESKRFNHFRQNFQWRMRELRGRSEQENLIGRVREMGQRGEIYRSDFGGNYYFSREPLQGDPRALSPQEIRRIAHVCREIPQLVINLDAERNSMVYSTSDLKSLVNLIFDEFGGVSLMDLREIFKFLLTGRTPSDVSLGEVEGRPGMTDIAASNELAVEETVNSICERLSPSLQAVTFATMQGIRQEQTASLLGITRQTVAVHQRRVVELLKPYFEDLRDYEKDTLSSALIWRFEASWQELVQQKGATV